MKVLLSVLFFITVFDTSAQVINVDKIQENSYINFYSVGGQPVLNAKYIRVVRGTAFFIDEYLPALLVAGNGNKYKAEKVKIDLLANEIHFMDHAGTEKISSVPVKDIYLTDEKNKKSYLLKNEVSLSSATGVKRGWYLQLAIGEASLFQYNFKIISEIRPYGSATTEQSINDKEEYFLLVNNEWMAIKKLKDLPSLFPSHTKEIEVFIKNDTQGITLAEKLTATVNHYNSLVK